MFFNVFFLHCRRILCTLYIISLEIYVMYIIYPLYIYISTIHLEFSIHVVLVEYPMLSSVVQSPQMSREWLVYAQDTVKLLCRCCNMVPCLPSLRMIGINFISYADIFTHCAWDWCFYVNTVLILEVLVLCTYWWCNPSDLVFRSVQPDSPGQFTPKNDWQLVDVHPPIDMIPWVLNRRWVPGLPFFHG